MALKLWQTRTPFLAAIQILLLMGCAEDADSSSKPEELTSPTPTPGPYLGQSTWGGRYIDYWSEPVDADTHLFLNVETQQDGHLEALIYHMWGTLVIDGLEVPTNKGHWMYGTYVWPGIIDLSGELEDYSLDVHIEYDYEVGWMIYTLNLNGDYYEYTSFIAEYDYIPFNY